MVRKKSTLKTNSLIYVIVQGIPLTGQCFKMQIKHCNQGSIIATFYKEVFVNLSHLKRLINGNCCFTRYIFPVAPYLHVREPLV